VRGVATRVPYGMRASKTWAFSVHLNTRKLSEPTLAKITSITLKEIHEYYYT